MISFRETEVPADNVLGLNLVLDTPMVVFNAKNEWRKVAIIK